jgi:hypothetical protein
MGIQTLYGTINTGDGNDTITGTGFSHGIFINYGGTLDTGGGNDIITATGFRGLTNYSTINTSDGNDIITGTANGTSSGISGHGSIDTGNGNDIVTGISTTGYDGIISGGSVTLGDGNDLITGISTGSSFGVGIIVVSTTTIDTGNGDDIITGISNGYGIRNNGTINTGNGNDSIITDGGFEGSIGKSFLGDGKDYLKGFGSGEFYGGNDKDALELTSGSYTVGISGTAVNFTKHSIIMNTSEFEILIGGNTTYDFSSLTNGQTIFVA